MMATIESVVVRFECPGCGIRILISGPEDKAYAEQFAASALHAKCKVT